jgi:hypothetical protein
MDMLLWRKSERDGPHTDFEEPDLARDVPASGNGNSEK